MFVFATLANILAIGAFAAFARITGACLAIATLAETLLVFYAATDSGSAFAFISTARAFSVFSRATCAAGNLSFIHRLGIDF